MAKRIIRMSHAEATEALRREESWKDRGLSFSNRRLGALRRQVAFLEIQSTLTLEPMFRVYTAISGGATGARAAYMKENGQELRFGSREKAQDYIDGCRAARTARTAFTQTYSIEEVPMI